MAEEQEKTIKQPQPQGDRDGYCKIMFSMDMLEAYMVIEPPVGDGKWPTVEDAMEAIELQNIKYGLNEEAVIGAVNRRRTIEVPIAKGKPAIPGNDTELNSYYALNDLKKMYLDSLVEDENGRVDFRNVKSVETVFDGQIIGEKILPTDGEDGINVLGNTIKSEPGKERLIKLGKNTRWDEEELRIIATGNGKPTLLNNCISVLPIHEVRGDIGFKTGNLNFPGNLVVHGNVTPGFSVIAEGEIVIIGDVDTATEISAGGRLSIRGSVYGMDKTKLSCGGEFTAKSINRATVEAKGNVLVRDSIMYSQITSGKKVIVDKGKGWIVGGKVCAGEMISTRIVGSKLGAATDLEVGVTIKPTEESPIVQLEEVEIDTEQVTPVGYTYLLSLEEAPKNVSYDKSRIIKVKDLLYPGVKISISTGSCLIRDETKFVILYCTYEGKIVAQSYR